MANDVFLSHTPDQIAFITELPMKILCNGSAKPVNMYVFKSCLHW